jgi:tetratricopeptide (TPR) repeat protein
MEQKPKALDMAKSGLQQWEDGNLAEAETMTREALGLLPPDHWAAPEVRGQLASILSAQGRHAEAKTEFQRALEDELGEGQNASKTALRAIRYFFGEHLVRAGDPKGALDIIRPALGQDRDVMLRLVESDAHLALGHADQALEALNHALSGAQATDVRSEIQERIAKLRRQ